MRHLRVVEPPLGRKIGRRVRAAALTQPEVVVDTAYPVQVEDGLLARRDRCTSQAFHGREPSATCQRNDNSSATTRLLTRQTVPRARTMIATTPIRRHG